MKDINFDNIKINNNSTLDYADRTINIYDTVDEVNAYLEENVSIEEKIENITEQDSKHTKTISVFVGWYS